MSNAIVRRLELVPGKFKCPLPGTYHYHEIASWGDFDWLYLVTNSGLRASERPKHRLTPSGSGRARRSTG